MTLIRSLSVALALIVMYPLAAVAEETAERSLSDILAARGFSLSKLTLPDAATPFPIERLREVRFQSVATFDWFPEGPTYRATDGSYFFSGSHALTRVDAKGVLHEVLAEPGGGGTHFLPDGSVLIVGHVGLRRLFPDGRVALLADGKQIGAGNDLSVGIHGEIYFSVPREGIYRLTGGDHGRLEQVSDQGCNGLEVDPSGEFLYVAGSRVQRYHIDINRATLGTPETVYEFPKGQGGGDGCTFDAWGNFYTMRFRTGTIRVINPGQKKLIAEIPVGVVPASNLTFGGSKNSELFVTAGAPKSDNCQVLKTNLGVTGFCGHVGATTYPVIRFLEQHGDMAAFKAVSAAAPDAEDAPVKVTAFIENHCLDCHSGEDSERGFDLGGLGFDLNDTTVHEKWVRALDRVQRGEMPPPDAAQPKAKDVDAYVKELRPVLIAAEETRIATEGRSTIRRLSRAEHINALRDMLHMPLLEAGNKLPPDPLSDGFGKSSSTLPFSHVQVDRYLEVADDALRAAMAPQYEKPQPKKSSVWIKDLRGKTVFLDKGRPKEQETLRLIRDCNSLYLEFKHGSGIPMIGRTRDLTFESHPGNFKTKKHGYALDARPYIDAIGIVSNAPMKIGRATEAGRYTISLDAFAFQANRGNVTPTDRTEVVAVYGDTNLLGTLDVTTDSSLQRLDVDLKAGEEIKVAMATLPLWRIEIGDKTARYLSVNVPAVAVRGFEVQGPFVDVWPPKSHRRLFGNLPSQPIENQQPKSSLDYRVTSEAPAEDARRLLASFMNSAYRREVKPRDFVIPMSLFEKRLGGGASFQDAMIAAYGAVLSSPSFTLVAMRTGPLSSDELANRLSLFLWNSPADKQLRDSLSGDILSDRDRYKKFVDQMIADPRADRFIEHFLDHWLDLRNIGVTEPDENLYSGYSTWTLESMLLETRGFFKEMIHRDLPVRSVIDSDFLMINGELAELYGIEGASGADVKRVEIDDKSVRGGLLTQASVMKVSANGTTTSPVVRGVYVMDRFLGDPPPPPPEAVAAVEPDLSGVTTIRQQLARHRAEPTCASCHRKIDPPGFALESFDVMGRFRERYHSLDQGEPVAGINRRAKQIKYKLALPVDCSGEMANGQQFADINQFRQRVLKDERALARNLLQRLVVYATGHPVGISDRKHVEAILDSTAENGYGIRSMIHGLVESPMFRNK